MLVQALRSVIYPTTTHRFHTTIPLLWLVVFMGAFQATYLVITGQMNAEGGREMADIAERMVLGFGYSSPYLPTGEGGPTRVSPPLYVWLIGAVYWLLGIKTEAANTVLHLMNIAFNSITLVTLYDVNRKWFGERFAQLYALVFSVQPHILLLTGGIWESTLTLMFLALILKYVVCGFNPDQIMHWLKLGILFGLTALCNPAWTLMYPLLCLLLLGSARLLQQPSRSVSCIMIAVIAYGVIISPWLIRNHNTSGTLSYIRNMDGPELYKGNHPAALGGHGTLFAEYWIYKSPEQQHLYQEMGEADYDRYMLERAMSIIVEDPLRYTGKIIMRIAMWYSGDVDALLYWHEVENWKKFSFGIVLTAFGIVTGGLALYGTWAMRKLNTDHYPERLWSLWIYVYFLPVPYFLIITGFRYQASLMPFTLIPALYALTYLQSKCSHTRK